MVVPGGAGFQYTVGGTCSYQGAANSSRRSFRRAARRRPEGTTEPGEKGVGVLLATSVQEVERPVSPELLPLPISFLVNEVAESERISGLSRAVRSSVKRRAGWANAGVRSVNETFGKTATSEVGGRPSAMQLSSLSRISDANREKALPIAVLPRKPSKHFAVQ